MVGPELMAHNVVLHFVGWCVQPSPAQKFPSNLLLRRHRDSLRAASSPNYVPAVVPKESNTAKPVVRDHGRNVCVGTAPHRGPVHRCLHSLKHEASVGI